MAPNNPVSIYLSLSLRLCSLTLKKLIVLKELDRELSSVVIAVKIQVKWHRYYVTTVYVLVYRRWSVAESLGVQDITRAQSFTQDTVVTEQLPRRQLAQWQDRIERNKMECGGLKRCIVGYTEGVISEHLEALSIPQSSLWSHGSCLLFL